MAILAVVLWLVPILVESTAWMSMQTLMAAPLPRLLSSSASCVQLAQADPTATNGSLWGQTILPGFGEASGWFGVPVCANGVNEVAPGGANVSCDQSPSDMAATGCAPGRATADGYGLSFQCVELVTRFAAWAYNDPPSRWRGDAQYLWLSGHHPDDFSAVPNGGTQAPQPGDILIWGSVDSQGRPWPAGPAGGHTAVVAAVDMSSGHVTFVEENMLGHRDGVAINIPRETTTLTQSASGHWTIGPTYGTNGGRALYGWLHSSRDTSHFPDHVSTVKPSPSPTVPARGEATPSPTPTASTTTSSAATVSQDLPSLTQGALVTGSGALAELVWSDTHTPNRSTPSAASTPAGTSEAPPPHVMVESLGAPPDIVLAPDQTPVVVALPTGERYIFVRSADGALYSAYTSPQQPGIAWQSLGSPPGVTLVGSVTARWESDGMRVGALGSDGAYWLCSGPAGMLGVWLSLGHPAQTLLQGVPALVSMPAPGGASANASSVSLTTAQSAPPLRVLAMGVDGQLYEAGWSLANAARPPSGGTNALAPGWSAWDAVHLPDVTAPLQGAFVLATDQVEAFQPGAATDQFVLLASDVTGHHWVLAPGRQADQPWSATQVALPSATSSVVAAVIHHTPNASATGTSVPATVRADLLDLFIADVEQPTVRSSATSNSALESSAPPDPSASSSLPSPTPTAAAPSPIHQATRPQSAPASLETVLERTFSLDPASSVSAQRTGSWTSLGALPATLGTTGTTAHTSSTPSTSSPQRLAAQQTIGSSARALDLGTLGSALWSAQGDAITLLGAPGVVQRLEPLSTQSEQGTQITAITIGSAPKPGSFSDSFSGATLNPAWLVTTSAPISAQAPALARVSTGALTLSVPSTPYSQSGASMSTVQTPPSGSTGSTGLETVTAMQGAPAPESAVTAHVQPGSAGMSSTTAKSQGETAEAGLLLRLDDWDAVTLALRRDHTVAFCATTVGNAPWCSVTPVPANVSLTQGAYLRIMQAGSALAGSISVDGSHWTAVGEWNIAWLPSASSMLGAYAPPVAPSENAPGGNNNWLMYTSIGLFITASQAAASSASQAEIPSAQFSDFTISSAGATSASAQPTATAPTP